MYYFSLTVRDPLKRPLSINALRQLSDGCKLHILIVEVNKKLKAKQVTVPL